MIARLSRWLGWWPAALAALIWIAAVAWPMIALLPELARSAGAAGASSTSGFKSMGELLVTSVVWAAIVALGAVIVGWMPGRVLGSLLNRRGFVPAAAFMLVPLCLPSYLVFYAWWQSWPAGTALHNWVIAHHAMQWAREGTLLVGLVCWSWPLATLSIAGAAARRPRARDEMLLADGAPRWRIALDHVRTDAPGVALGVLLIWLTTLNNTTCFDLSEVFTFANELRAREALGATPPQVLAAGLPMVAIALAGALAVWWFVSRRSAAPPWQSSPAGRGAGGGSVAIWLVSVALPLGLFWRGVAAAGGGWRAVGEFTTLYGGNVAATLIFALISGFAGMFAAFGLAMMWHSDRWFWRMLAHIISITWLIWSLLPGTIIGLALHLGFDRFFNDWLPAMLSHAPQDVQRTVLDTMKPAILNLAHLASGGFVAVLLARWSVMSEPRALRDLRRIDGAQGLSGLWRSGRPALLAAAFASASIIAVLAVGETAVTAQVVPPLPMNQTPIAMTLLNDMHYQRPQTVLVASLLLVALALGAATLTALLWRGAISAGRGRAAATGAPLLLIACLVLPGCARGPEASPLDPDYTFGSPGQALGQFGYARAIDADPVHNWVYVIDKTARVQRFGFDNKERKWKPQLEWHMPEMQQGKPTGVSVGPDGNVYVADTHYFRVIEYDPEGHEIRRFGYGYGAGPGQFIYVTDIAFAPDGNLYISEYGGNDRVQVFRPDGTYLFGFGSMGFDEGQFRRPQSLAFSNDGKELYITDACNHRIVVTDLQGRWLRTFGVAGREPGQLCYPYGLKVLPDGTLLVAEFGNNRIQRFDRNGRSLGVYGGLGRGPGQLQCPWGVTATKDQVFVLDSGNNRVQVVKMF